MSEGIYSSNMVCDICGLDDRFETRLKEANGGLISTSFYTFYTIYDENFDRKNACNGCQNIEIRRRRLAGEPDLSWHNWPDESGYPMCKCGHNFHGHGHEAICIAKVHYGMKRCHCLRYEPAA